MSNLGWKFYRDYYLLGNGASIFQQSRTQDEQKALFRQKNEPFLLARFDENLIRSLQVANANTFILETAYPGLTSGTGISHSSGLTGEYKLGFQFDHTTGLPILPGSSVKGRLRSVFTNRLRQQAKAVKIPGLKEKLLRKADQKEKYLLTLIRQICGVELNPKQLHQLEWAIFEGVDLLFRDEKPDYENSPRLAVYDCDVFFDAYISRGNEMGHFLGNDYITPHKHKTKPKLDPFVNPVPVQFLKVLPAIEWTFQFGLKPTLLNNDITFSITQKMDLFEAILLDWGIGAKTNVGYGQLISPVSILERMSSPETEEKPKRVIEPFNGKIKPGVQLDAAYVEPVKNQKNRHRCKVWLVVGGVVKEMSVDCIYGSPLTIGQAVRIQVKDGKDKINLAEIIKPY